MDSEIRKILEAEERRQRDTLQMIPSENYASAAVRALEGSVFANKYSEGYPDRRYYQGNRNVDLVEKLAIERAKKLFAVPHANVQPYSGSPANAAVLFALAEAGDTIMGLKLAAGGHLTHGQPQITFSGRYFRSVQFGLDNEGLLDYEEIHELALREKPKVMIIGTTAYPLVFDWQRFAQIAEEVGAWLVADVAHVAGLILADAYPSPVPHAEVVTTTTHKTLRGPRGAIIMVTERGIRRDPDVAGKIDRAVFPGLQGGPHDNTTAAIAQCLFEAGQPEFRQYGQQIVKNAKALAKGLQEGGLTLVGGGTECHLLLVDLRPLSLSGNVLAEALEVAGIVCNRNAVPNDHMPPFYPSGIRMGTPALTTRGMKEREMETIAQWILQVIEHIEEERLPEKPEARAPFLKEYRKRIAGDPFLQKIAAEVKSLAGNFPVP
ncbi:MAG: serine hydroxymethyltransferase [Chloroflexi bacterium]|nr:serine hydroxymethyltransferase [Chloroflexota bacterium]